ncbi:hypothetical protein GEV33_006893 [Tenebrio molitor]|uniref:DUF5641 domain-containing protein n=1 Tax=Tenebrio molitor TaxID=7067 RepID=A0A8J6HKA3_TENMO|nr:hypothetical protein GEV33_006893 [Tenebrio molitor]
MYRMIEIHPDHTDYQRIVWRENTEDPLKTYRLTTLSYGTKPASFIAIRCLKELALQKVNRYPEAAEAIQQDFYVDDLLTGGDSLENLITTRSNNSNFSSWCPDSHEPNLNVSFDKDAYTKTLGLFWNPNHDSLRYQVKQCDTPKGLTKREILSKTAQSRLASMWCNVRAQHFFDVTLKDRQLMGRCDVAMLRCCAVAECRPHLIRDDVALRCSVACLYAPLQLSTCVNCHCACACVKFSMVIGYLKRTIGEVVLSYEELYTLLTRIEAVLNSRPLCPLSNDPNDLNPLTSGHFLIEEPLTYISERDLTTKRINRLTQWQRVEQMRQHFWHRWQRDYLVQNINRSKQLRGSGSRPSTPALEVSSMVILVEDNTPPLQWKLGRIVELHPGSDGVVRVVSVKTVNGIFKRATRKVCVLPANE